MSSGGVTVRNISYPMEQYSEGVDIYCKVWFTADKIIKFKLPYNGKANIETEKEFVRRGLIENV